jgi:hypothetical protein
MAYPTAVNGQITDAVTQTNVKITGENPAQVDGASPNEQGQQEVDASKPSDGEEG